MTDTLQNKINRIARNTAFLSSEDMTEGMTYRQWLIGQAIVGLSSTVDRHPDRLANSIHGVSQAAAALADAVILEQAMRTMPKVRCSVCEKMATSNPCDECGPTLNDEPEDGVDLAAHLPTVPVALCPECGKPKAFDSANPCNHECHYPF
jgi:membrane protease subunit (stomatin/prohibitin family)